MSLPRHSGRAQRGPESMTTKFAMIAPFVVMDSGLAGFARAPE